MKPSPSGSPMSTSAVSGRSLGAAANASSTLPASPTTACPRLDRIRPARPRKQASSSTTSTERDTGPSSQSPTRATVGVARNRLPASGTGGSGSPPPRCLASASNAEEHDEHGGGRPGELEADRAVLRGPRQRRPGGPGQRLAARQPVLGAAGPPAAAGRPPRHHL